MDDLDQVVWDLELDADRSMRYHNMRAGFFEAWHTFTLIAVLFLGSASFLAVMDLLTPAIGLVGLSSKQVVAGASVLSALLGLCELGFQYTQQAVRHRACEAVYRDILGDLRVADHNSVDEVRSLVRKYEKVDSGFETFRRVVNMVSRNQVLAAHGYPTTRLSWLKLLLKNYLPFSSTSFE